MAGERKCVRYVMEKKTFYIFLLEAIKVSFSVFSPWGKKRPKDSFPADLLSLQTCFWRINFSLFPSHPFRSRLETVPTIYSSLYVSKRVNAKIHLRAFHCINKIQCMKINSIFLRWSIHVECVLRFFWKSHHIIRVEKRKRISPGVGFGCLLKIEALKTHLVR